MAFLYFLPKNNKFSPPFEPATITSNYSTYIDITTGVPTGTVYAFYGTQYTTPANPNWIDYFNVLPKGNCELGAMHSSLDNGASTYFSTPNGHYLRFWRNDYYVAGVLQEWIEVFCDDGNGGEYGILAQRVDNYVNGWRYWMSIQVDLDAGKAVPTTLMLISPDSVTGSANITISGGGVESNVTKAKALFDVVDDALMTTDPYAPGDYSEPSGTPAGDFDNTSDTISIPSVPALNLSLNHFLSAYVPTLTDINDLADYIWGNYDKTDTNKLLSKIFADPSDAILSLHMLPFTPGSSTAIPVTIGRFVSGVSMPPMTAQFTDVDCGSLTINEYWGCYLDYTATNLILFLPYVGEVTLDPDEVMGQTVSVLYRVDNLTGAFVCFVSTADKILGQYNGCCALSVPVSSADYRQLNSAILGAAMSAVGGVMTAAGAGAALAAGAAEGSIGSLNLSGGGISAAANVAQSKVHHSRSGALGGAAGFLGSQKPYLIIHRARQCLPEGLNERAGYPSMITARLGDQYGFTSVSSIILDGLPYTDEELSELAGILKEGFII